MKLENFANVAKWVEAELRKPDIKDYMQCVNDDDIVNAFKVPEALVWDVEKGHHPSLNDFWMSSRFKFGSHTADVYVGVSQYKNRPIRGNWELKINYQSVVSGSGELPERFDETPAVAA